MATRHVLIIDDNRMNIDILGILLRREQIEFSAVESPHDLEQALDAIEHLDVMFLDLEFQTSNGFQILEYIREHPRFGHVPVAACTVHLNQIQQTREAGFDSFVGKPLSAQKFPNQIQRILSGQAVWEV